MPAYIPVRTPRGRRRHAMPEIGAGRVMCGRPAARVIIDECEPDCAGCLRAIAAAVREMGE